MSIKTKKILKALAIAVLVIAFFILLGRIFKREAVGALPGSGWEEKQGKNSSMMTYPYSVDQYVFPYDADQTGKIAIKVDDLDAAAQGVRNVAAKQGGDIVYYEMNNATSKIRNGLMVVKVSKDKFDSAFTMLKSQGNLVVQESVSKNQDVPQVCPMMASTQEKAVQTNADNAATKKDDAVNDQAVIAPAPISCPSLGVQRNFSYIKVVLAANERKQGFLGGENENGMMVNSLEKTGKFVLIVMVVKIAVTIFVLICLLLLLVHFLKNAFLNHHKKHEHHVQEQKKTQIKPLTKISRAVVKRKAVVKTRK